MSRQRLRPSISDSSHLTCPRCVGIGSIRSVESLALSILRLIGEDARKERTTRIIAQVPVEVATYLINEKRNDLREVGDRTRTDIVIVPNPHLQTPDYQLRRVRDDEVGLPENNQLSFQIPVPPVVADPTGASADKPPAEAPAAAAFMPPPVAMPPPPVVAAPAPVVAAVVADKPTIGIFTHLWRFFFGTGAGAVAANDDQHLQQRPRTAGARSNAGDGHRDAGRSSHAGSGRDSPRQRGPRAGRGGHGGQGSRGEPRSEGRDGSGSSRPPPRDAQGQRQERGDRHERVERNAPARTEMPRRDEHRPEERPRPQPQQAVEAQRPPADMAAAPTAPEASGSVTEGQGPPSSPRADGDRGPRRSRRGGRRRRGGRDREGPPRDGAPQQQSFETASGSSDGYSGQSGDSSGGGSAHAGDNGPVMSWTGTPAPAVTPAPTAPKESSPPASAPPVDGPAKQVIWSSGPAPTSWHGSGDSRE
jgi:ribonuclease E